MASQLPFKIELFNRPEWIPAKNLSFHFQQKLRFVITRRGGFSTINFGQSFWRKRTEDAVIERGNAAVRRFLAFHPPGSVVRMFHQTLLLLPACGVTAVEASALNELSGGACATDTIDMNAYTSLSVSGRGCCPSISVKPCSEV